MSLHLVLVEPAGPLNVGSVARLCANFGLSGLRLVAPRCDPLDDEARRMAVHGLPLLERAPRFASLAEAVADCRRVVACTGRLEGPPLPLEGPQPCLSWLLEGQGGVGRGGEAPQASGALVFGREDRGLSNDELLQAGRLLTLSTDPVYTSLNLSHAVALVLHELHGLRRRGAGAGGSDPAGSVGPIPPGPAAAAPPSGDPGQDCCSRGELEAALADAEALLLEVGYLYPHTARARMAKLRALLQRAGIRSSEVALLRGMVCQLRWASRRPCPPGPRH